MAKFAVLGAKIMPPLRDTMRFINGKQRDLCPADHVLEAGRDDPFRCHIQEVEFAAADRVAHIHELFARQRGIERCGADTQLLERLHLVAHQRDQRRDHNADPVPAQRGNLKAQRFAGAGGKQHHCIAT